MLMDPYGQYQTLPKAYMACTDYAFQQVFTGAADYNTAIRRACSGIVKHAFLSHTLPGYTPGWKRRFGAISWVVSA